MWVIYSEVGYISSIVISLAAFLGLWASIIMIYDTATGIVVGWFPSLVVAPFVFGLSFLLWPLILLSIFSFFILVLYEFVRD